jgi:predicted nuclease of restriction endonuclease-like (RecB) superfamily
MNKVSPLNNTEEYKSFFVEIKNKVYKTQNEALKRVNNELINLYFDIGKTIVEKQEKHNWKKSIVENLAKDLQSEFVGNKSFSSRNLWHMRNFYVSYNEDKKLKTLSSEISWSHNIAIMQKCKDDLQKEFYLKMSSRSNWSYRTLLNHIENKSYERFAINQTNFDDTVKKSDITEANLSVKDEYIFDFLELNEEHKERELENAIVKNIRKFLIEMGSYFSFIGNQYRLEVDGEDFFIDLLLYHRKLKSLVAIELKIGKFKPEYAGKMQFYLSLLNEQVKLEDENPSIGIIICKEKNRTIVEYTLKEVNQPIGVGTYQTLKSLPDDYAKYFPSSEEIAEKLKVLK